MRKAVGRRQAEALEGHHRIGGEDWDWSELLGRGTNPLRAVFIALAIWFVWYFWR